jgi:hypothetical protein
MKGFQGPVVSTRQGGWEVTDHEERKDTNTCILSRVRVPRALSLTLP